MSTFYQWPPCRNCKSVFPQAVVIEDQQYFETFAKHPTFTDLNVFIVVQGFLSPDLEESAWVQETYPALMKWYRNMEKYTQKTAALMT